MRNVSLDVLRATAIILVFCYHSEGALLVSRFGWLGVDLFFVLSGYLVSRLLFREYEIVGRVRPGTFLARRAFKVYPQFYTLILVTVALSLPWNGRPLAPVLAEVFFLQNYTRGVWSHTWSLAVEEHFYILLSVVIAILARRGGVDPFRPLPRVILATCAIVLALRTLVSLFSPSISNASLVFPTHMRFDSFLTGVLVAYYEIYRADELLAWIRRARNWLAPASIVLLTPATFLLREDLFMVTVGFTMTSCGFALLLLHVLYPVKRFPSGRGTQVLANLGEMSYGFYLWHGLVILQIDSMRVAWIPQQLHLVITFAACVVVAWATTQLIELPALRLRDRLFPSPEKVRKNVIAVAHTAG